MEDYSAFTSDLKTLGIEITDKQIDQFNTYFELLVEWNKVMNLTTITEFSDVCKLHFVDSLMASKFYDFSAKNYSLVDIGTGAGFPGIPLKIIFPNLNVSLLDSLNKRLKFLNEVIDKLGLNNEEGQIVTVHGRAEDMAAHSKTGILREKFDIGCARAVANLSTLSEYCLPYVKKRGVFISYKSADIKDEVSSAGKAIKLLGGKTRSVNEFVLPDTDVNRSIIIIDKCKNTMPMYPRKAGLPSKEPL